MSDFFTWNNDFEIKSTILFYFLFIPSIFCSPFPPVFGLFKCFSEFYLNLVTLSSISLHYFLVAFLGIRLYIWESCQFIASQFQIRSLQPFFFFFGPAL